jgi:hypothetical protein
VSSFDVELFYRYCICVFAMSDKLLNHQELFGLVRILLKIICSVLLLFIHQLIFITIIRLIPFYFLQRLFICRSYLMFNMWRVQSEATAIIEDWFYKQVYLYMFRIMTTSLVVCSYCGVNMLFNNIG